MREEAPIIRSKYSDAQSMGILKHAEGRVPIGKLCLGYGMSSASFCKWRAKYGGMYASFMAQMKELDEEIKRMYAERSVQNDLLKEALEKRGRIVST
jgi:putative transposase